MVRVLALYSDNPSSNLAEAYCVLANYLKRMRINKTEAGDGPF